MTPAEAQCEMHTVHGGFPAVSRREIQRTIVLLPVGGTGVRVALAAVFPVGRYGITQGIQHALGSVRMQAIAQFWMVLMQAGAQFLIGRVRLVLAPIRAGFRNEEVP